MKWSVKILLFAFLLNVNYIFAGGTDNNTSPSNTNVSEERILFLIDSVLNLKNPPKWVLEDLQKLIKLKYETPEVTNTNVTSNSIATENSDELFTCWSSEKINPFPDSIVKADTGALVKFDVTKFCMPFIGEITSPYGYREKQFHKGVDIDLIKGNPVKASFDGIVRIAKKYGAYGNVVVIRHKDGLETVYAHLSKIKVKTGDKINAGTLIGLGGSTGRSTGSHLHYEIRYKGTPLNPANFISFNENKLRDAEFLIKKNKRGYSAFPANATFHKVRKGESLYVISQKYGLSIKQLKALNGIAPKSKSYLKPGQLLRIS